MKTEAFYELKLGERFGLKQVLVGRLISTSTPVVALLDRRVIRSDAVVPVLRPFDV